VLNGIAVALMKFSAATVRKGGTQIMLSWSITFLIIGLIAAVLGFTGVAGAATEIAWVLFVVFIVLFIASMFMGRGRVT
jgi:uncharacterized membrane protein YtjA (UPF0391 family)